MFACRTTLASKKFQENPVGKQFENLDPDCRFEAAMNQLEKLLCVRRAKQLLPPLLKVEETLTSILALEQEPLPQGIIKTDVVFFIKDVRIHLAVHGAYFLWLPGGNGCLTGLGAQHYQRSIPDCPRCS